MSRTLLSANQNVRAQGTIRQWQFDDELLQANMWLLDGELIEGSIVPPEIKTFIIKFSLFWKKFPAPYFATFIQKHPINFMFYLYTSYQFYVLFMGQFVKSWWGLSLDQGEIGHPSPPDNTSTIFLNIFNFIFFHKIHSSTSLNGCHGIRKGRINN